MLRNYNTPSTFQARRYHMLKKPTVLTNVYGTLRNYKVHPTLPATTHSSTTCRDFMIQHLEQRGLPIWRMFLIPSDKYEMRSFHLPRTRPGSVLGGGGLCWVEALYLGGGGIGAHPELYLGWVRMLKISLCEYVWERLRKTFQAGLGSGRGEDEEETKSWSFQTGRLWSPHILL